MLRYAVSLVPDDDVVIVDCPDIPGVHTFGDNEEDALRHAVDAVDSMLEMLMDDRKPIPEPRARRKHYVTLTPLKEAKLTLYNLMRKRGLRKADLTRLLDWKPVQVDRLFDLQHNSKVEQLQQAFQALGKELVMSFQVKDAA